jgi:hypothetical protein
LGDSFQFGLATLIHYILWIILKSEQNQEKLAPLSSTPPNFKLQKLNMKTKKGIRSGAIITYFITHQGCIYFILFLVARLEIWWALIWMALLTGSVLSAELYSAACSGPSGDCYHSPWRRFRSHQVPAVAQVRSGLMDGAFVFEPQCIINYSI